jgi:Flp pilus assembly protein TadG
MKRAVEIVVRTDGCALHAGNADSESGQSIVELTLLLPLLFLIFLAGTDLARLFYHASGLAQAARAGAAYGAQNLGTAANSTGMTKAATDSAAADLGTITVAPAPSQSFQCANDPPTTVETPCADGRAPKVFVSVTVQKSFSTLFKYPGMAHTVNVSRTAIMRVQ